MKNYYGQYPDIYSTDDTRYTFFFDSGERVTLTAGEDGITQGWIHALKLEHRNEYNMLRHGLRAGDANSARLISLDRYLADTGDAGKFICDESSNVEEIFIKKIDIAEKRGRIRMALASLTPEQRELLMRVRIKGVSITVTAASQGVTRQAIQNRLSKIENRIKKMLC